jgi:hypothetical protein
MKGARRVARKSGTNVPACHPPGRNRCRRGIGSTSTPHDSPGTICAYRGPAGTRRSVAGSVAASRGGSHSNSTRRSSATGCSHPCATCGRRSHRVARHRVPGLERGLASPQRRRGVRAGRVGPRPRTIAVNLPGRDSRADVPSRGSSAVGACLGACASNGRPGRGPLQHP